MGLIRERKTRMQVAREGMARLKGQWEQAEITSRMYVKGLIYQ